jgi:very-short-patch-repair endonuclease
MMPREKVGTHGIVCGSHPQEKVELARRMRRTMTPAATLLWSALRRHQLGGLHFRRQQVIDGFIVDFYYHEARPVVELDGTVHVGHEEYDAERNRILAVRGLRTVHIRNDRIFSDLDGVLAQILAAAQQS